MIIIAWKPVEAPFFVHPSATERCCFIYMMLLLPHARDAGGLVCSTPSQNILGFDTQYPQPIPADIKPDAWLLLTEKNGGFPLEFNYIGWMCLLTFVKRKCDETFLKAYMTTLAFCHAPNSMKEHCPPHFGRNPCVEKWAEWNVSLNVTLLGFSTQRAVWNWKHWPCTACMPGYYLPCLFFY